MKNINPSGERHLKNRLEEHEFDFDPQAWKSMNKKLNLHNPRRNPLWVSSLICLTIAMSLLSVAWYVPFEPIQEFLEKTFEFEKTETPEKVIEAPRAYLNEQVETINFLEENSLENLVPQKQNTNNQNTPVAPLPQMIPFELLPTGESLNERTDETTKPIAAISGLVEYSEEENIAVNLPLKRKVTAGFFGGGTVAVSGSPLIPAGAVSPGIGVFVGYNINDKWSVQAEVNFRKGFVQPFTAKEERDEFLTLPPPTIPNKTAFDRVVENQEVVAKNLTILEFPVLAKYKVNQKSSVMAGVRPSWIHVKDSNSDNSTADASPSTIYNKVDVGLSVGYELQLSERVAVSVRYSQGLTDLFKENEDTYYNNDFQASVRYTLNP